MNFCVVVVVVVYRFMFDIVSNARCSNYSSGYVTTVSVKCFQQLLWQQEINVVWCVSGSWGMSGLVDFLDSVDYSSSIQCGICKCVLKGEGGKWVKG